MGPFFLEKNGFGVGYIKCKSYHKCFGDTGPHWGFGNHHTLTSTTSWNSGVTNVIIQNLCVQINRCFHGFFSPTLSDLPEYLRIRGSDIKRSNGIWIVFFSLCLNVMGGKSLLNWLFHSQLHQLFKSFIYIQTLQRHQCSWNLI